MRSRPERSRHIIKEPSNVIGTIFVLVQASCSYPPHQTLLSSPCRLHLPPESVASQVIPRWIIPHRPSFKTKSVELKWKQQLCREDTQSVVSSILLHLFIIEHILDNAVETPSLVFTFTHNNNNNIISLLNSIATHYFTCTTYLDAAAAASNTSISIRERCLSHTCRESALNDTCDEKCSFKDKDK